MSHHILDELPDIFKPTITNAPRNYQRYMDSITAYKAAKTDLNKNTLYVALRACYRETAVRPA